MMDDETAKRERLRVIHWMEQIQAGVAAGDRQAVERAKHILAWVAVNGTPDILGQVLRGILLAWDEQQPEWDQLFT